GAHRGIGADGDRRHQRRVGADKGAIADESPEFVDAIVVAGDGAGADIDSTANTGIADVAEVIDLAAWADLGLPGLDKIAHPGVRPQCGARPQTGKRPDVDTPAEGHRAFDHGIGLDYRAIADHCVADMAVGADMHIAAKADAAFEDAVDVDERVFTGL